MATAGRTGGFNQNLRPANSRAVVQINEAAVKAIALFLLAWRHEGKQALPTTAPRDRTRATYPSMYATEQTDSAGPVQDLIVDRWAQRCQVTTMKHALPTEIIRVMPSYNARGHSGLRAPVHDSARIQGGNWKIPGIQSAGHVYDDGECQLSIAEFISDHGLLNDTGSG